MTVTRALAWFADPAVAAATSPGSGEGFDVDEFATGPNTLYMVGTGREEASIAPLFRAFAEYVHAGAAFAGSLQPHGRLDPPLLMGRGHSDLPGLFAVVDGRQRGQGGS
jgi:type IV secretion system protein VirD4